MTNHRRTSKRRGDDVHTESVERKHANIGNEGTKVAAMTQMITSGRAIMKERRFEHDEYLFNIDGEPF